MYKKPLIFHAKYTFCMESLFRPGDIFLSLSIHLRAHFPLVNKIFKRSPIEKDVDSIHMHHARQIFHMHWSSLLRASEKLSFIQSARGELETWGKFSRKGRTYDTHARVENFVSRDNFPGYLLESERRPGRHWIPNFVFVHSLDSPLRAADKANRACCWSSPCPSPSVEMSSGYSRANSYVRILCMPEVIKHDACLSNIPPRMYAYKGTARVSR